MSQGRYLHRATPTEKKFGETSMLCVGFETTLPVFDQAKTFHVLDGAATVLGY
jgi:hypothetical protein